MAKGKTNSPLNIRVIDESLLDTPEVKDLIEKGHTVEYHPLTEVDIILGKNCHYMTHDLIKHLATTVKSTRARKKKEKAT